MTVGELMDYLEDLPKGWPVVVDGTALPASLLNNRRKINGVEVRNLAPEDKPRKPGVVLK